MTYKERFTVSVEYWNAYVSKQMDVILKTDKTLMGMQYACVNGSIHVTLIWMLQD